MGTYGSILSKDADTHGRDKGIPDDRKRRGREMITENQRDYIIGLYNELNMEIDIEEIEELSKSDAHERIQELLELKSEVY
jgi:hypothetical protein